MIVWPFVPQRDVVEALEWSTDIISCRAAEQRLSLRPTPRMTLRYTMILDKARAAMARTMARTASLEEFTVPLWPEATRLGGLAQGSDEVALDTSWAQYSAGREVLLFDEYNWYSVLTVDSVTPDSLLFTSGTPVSMGNAFIMPTYRMHPSQEFEFVRAAAEDLITVRAAFYGTDILDMAGNFGAVTYRGYPVLTVQPMAAGSLSERVIHSAATVDNGVGPVSIFKNLNYVTSTANMAWDCLTKPDLWELRRWLYAARGRQKGFWRPTWGQDITVASTIGAGDTTITVTSLGFTGQMVDRDIMLRLTSGAVLYCRVTHATQGIGNTELLHLAAPLGVEVATPSIDRVCFLNFARLNADRVELRHRAAGASSVQVPITEVLEP